MAASCVHKGSLEVVMSRQCFEYCRGSLGSSDALGEHTRVLPRRESL